MYEIKHATVKEVKHTFLLIIQVNKVVSLNVHQKKEKKTHRNEDVFFFKHFKL